ncbi:hypothetical protein Lal_00042590 [Lupinus albus]|nr:hypothetical protein Lal_00042590 [Lupinus albus]
MDVDEDSSEPDQKGEKSWEAHNSKRKGEHTCIHIGAAYSRQIKIYHQVCCSQKITLSRRHWFVIIKKGEIVKKILLLTLARNLLRVKSTRRSLRWTRRSRPSERPSVLILGILGISPKRESGRLSERSLGRL